jgi:superfamily II DNA or RNA helicase
MKKKIYDFVEKEPDKAYVSNKLWLPKKRIRLGPVQRALEFMVQTKDGQDTMKLWDQSKYHIICPREFLHPKVYGDYLFPFIDLRPQFKKVYFKDLVKPRNPEQQAAWDALAANDNGILNLGCGKGKTKLALKKIAQRGVPTLVIVPDGGILDQWRKSIHGDDRTPPGLEYRGKMGLIQGGVFDWKHDITLALVTSLWPKIEDGTCPDELFRHFGLVVYDEVHQIGAPKFSQTAWPFFGDRIGLTATVQREDGLDPIYRYHIGEPFYSDLKQDLVPEIFFQQTPVLLDPDLAKVGTMTNISVLRSMLGKDFVSNSYRYWCIKEAVDQGRKILCLGHSIAQLRLFHAMFPDSGIIIGDVPQEVRTDILRKHQLVFAIARLGATGVDDDRLDTLFWLSPFKSRIQLQQSMGRIQRYLEGKKHPVMVVFEDSFVGPLRTLCNKLKKTLREWKFKYSILHPIQTPAGLPPKVMKSYELQLKELTPDDDGIDAEL